MEVTKLSGSSGYQVFLHLALDDAITAFEEAYKEVSQQPQLTEDSATPELILLQYRLEQRRATALILAACCVEAVANLYLAQKATPDQFAILEWAKFMEKWTIIPSFFVPGYDFPEDGMLYNDLKRLNVSRNSLVHLKEEITKSGAIQLSGSRPKSSSDEHVFVGRCRSLPDRLLDHVATYDKSEAISQVRMILTVSPTMQKMKQLIKKSK